MYFIFTEKVALEPIVNSIVYTSDKYIIMSVVPVYKTPYGHYITTIFTKLSYWNVDVLGQKFKF